MMYHHFVSGIGAHVSVCVCVESLNQNLITTSGLIRSLHINQNSWRYTANEIGISGCCIPLLLKLIILTEFYQFMLLVLFICKTSLKFQNMYNDKPMILISTLV